MKTSEKIPLARARLYAVLYVLLAVVFLALSFRNVAAQAPSPRNFGGKILDNRICDCSNNFLILVGPPGPGYYIFQPGFSTLFSAGQLFRKGPEVLGTFVPGGKCVFSAGTPCSVTINGGIIVTVGTSL